MSDATPSTHEVPAIKALADLRSRLEQDRLALSQLAKAAAMHEDRDEHRRLRGEIEGVEMAMARLRAYETVLLSTSEAEELAVEAEKSKATDRILWNRRPTGMMDAGDIDEIVVHDCTVHVEQMDERCWWIGIYRPDGSYWMGNFTADRRGRMRFVEQENSGVEWADDDTHESLLPCTEMES